MTAALLVAEPPAIYALRPDLVVDATVLAVRIFAEAGKDAVSARVHNCNLHAPALIDYELANVAASKLRRREVSLAVASRALGDFSTLALKRHDPPPAELAALAERYGLDAYRAAYLWLAAVLKAPLATFDRELASAASNHLGKLAP